MTQNWLLELEKIMQTLRAPKGCPWDLEQNHDSLKKYLIEECSEVLDAIDNNDPEELKDELGDLLMNIYFHAQIAAENKQFTISDVAQNISEKMIRRHPHVFANENAANSDDVDRIWQEVKEKEKGKKDSILDGIPKNLPNLRKSQTIQKRVSKVGFDWQDWKGSFDKITEELQELKEEIERNDMEKAKEEFGDLMFSMANLARSLKFEADEALQFANNKFEKRFRSVEKTVKNSNRDWNDYSLDELDQIWDKIKAENV
ncbi:nucleoside triphosphate pyrophosphohydrolase [Lentisphaera profundi]|uniref:Nucleoside triphosphate pyrophosphohydrolase n=1 Tax=Lentisphaera profundi TaxID=1658616 RepID=A0ABY7VRA6_9BACT|nr:nucleoside triphosphate pyrophosphohydrolase [Lentisphaera profundi]WDE96735.1 nucleoside triphosphate pyrophosphohydrolase [Lentisphaera profundi]